jgi:hypothetical protein
MMGHAPRDLRMIAIPWLDVCLASRLPDLAGASQLKDMDTTSAWLGDTVTKAIAPAAGYTGNKLRTGWFPNQALAKLWVQYQAEGTINDSTPPSAPYNVTGSYANRQIKLNWDCDADLETGIKTFIIYRNGVLLTTLQYPNNPTTLFSLVKGYQRWQDGDQPAPSPAPAMTYTDAAVSDTGTYTYQISCVNWSDLAGAKSSSLMLKRGVVSAVRALASAPARGSTATFLRVNLGASALPLSAEVVALYDINGRLMASADGPRGVTRDLGRSAGTKADKVLIVKCVAR